MCRVRQHRSYKNIPLFFIFLTRELFLKGPWNIFFVCDAGVTYLNMSGSFNWIYSRRNFCEEPNQNGYVKNATFTFPLISQLGGTDKNARFFHFLSFRGLLSVKPSRLYKCARGRWEGGLDALPATTCVPTFVSAHVVIYLNLFALVFVSAAWAKLTVS